MSGVELAVAELDFELDADAEAWLDIELETLVEVENVVDTLNTFDTLVVLEATPTIVQCERRWLYGSYSALKLG